METFTVELEIDPEDALDSPRKLMLESMYDDYGEEEVNEWLRDALVANLEGGERSPVDDMIAGVVNAAYDQPEVIEQEL